MPLSELERVDAYDRSMVLITNVKVWRVVNIEIHVDHDPQKTTDLRHRLPFA